MAPRSRPSPAAAGVPSEVALTLERVSSVISIVSSPPNAQVMLDGTVVGRTAAPPEASGSATTSAPLVVSDVTNGSHTVELTRECFVTAVERVEVRRPDDYAIGPVTLRPAVATLSVTADQSGAQVFVDGRDRGTAPVTLNDVCEGAHDVELRTKFGGDIRHIEVRAGEQVSVAGTLKPVFAIVSSSGVPVAAAQDLRTLVERALAPAKSVLLVAPPADLADKALKANRLPADWLATDAAGRTVEPPAQAGVSRKDASARLAETFRAQGVASVTALDASRLAVSLLGAGSRTPDVVEVALDSPRSIAAAVARLDRSQGLWRPTIGLQVIDIVDAAGPVVVEIDKGGPAGGASVQVGDVVTQAGGKPVADAAALMAVLASRRAGESVALDVRGSDGAVRRADVKVASAARVIPLHEQSLLANRVLVDLRAHLADASDPFEQSVLRLNLAVALARVGDWAGARDQLQRVTLPDQRGVGAGTVQYLLGLAAHNLGNRAEAEAAFKAAAASDSLLTEDGPAVKDLAQAKLAEVAKGTQ
jgi:hypothetical protein